MSIIVILAAIIVLLAVLSLIPQAAQYPLLNVAVLLAGIALFLIGRGGH